MSFNPTDAELLEDIDFSQDIKGPALFVWWCGIEVGFVRPVTRHEHPEVRRKHKGHWYNPINFRGYFETKEAAACVLIREYVKENPDCEVAQAAIRKDYDFIRDYRQRIVDAVRKRMEEEEE